MSASTPSLTHLLPPSTRQPTQASRLRTPATNAIPLLASDSAKLYNRIHTGLVFGLLLFHFSGLVADPFNTMFYLLGEITLMQGIYCVVCLPRNGSWNSTAVASDKASGPSERHEKTPKLKSAAPGIVISSGSSSMRKRPTGLGKSSGAAGSSWQSRIMPASLSLILAHALPPIPLTILALVMGAPLWPYSLLPLTLLLSFHISLLACLPIFFTHGISPSAWWDVLAAWLPFDEAGVWGGFVGTFVGAWIGAIPMALDWDREWQKWPVTVLTAAYGGWCVGRILTADLRLGLGKRINLSERDGQEVYNRVADTAVNDEKKNE